MNAVLIQNTSTPSSSTSTSVFTSHTEPGSRDDDTADMLNVCLLIISIIGICGNSVTLLILSGSNISKANFYVLIMNQSIIDIVSCTATIGWLASYVWIDNVNKKGVFDWVICSLVKSQFTIAALTCVSSYNLGILALERMASVVYPAFHRNHSSGRNQKLASVAVWTFGIGIIIPHAALTNGITATGECHFWDKFPSLNASYVYEISFNFWFNAIPMAMMIFAYTSIYIRIRRKDMASKIKHNVVKMLSTCVLMYFVCHVVRLGLSVATRFTSVNRFLGVMWTFAILLMQTNATVNPIVYALQYQEYRNELGRRLYRVFGVRIYDDRKVAPTETSASTTNRSLA